MLISLFCDGDGLHLELDVITKQPADLYERARRWRLGVDVLVPNLPKNRELAGIKDVEIELHDIVERCGAATSAALVTAMRHKRFIVGLVQARIAATALAWARSWSGYATAPPPALHHTSRDSGPALLGRSSGCSR
jgi:hypothetical protein